MSDIWDEAASWTADQLDKSGSVPVDPDSDWLSRYITAKRAAQVFAERGKRVSEADARRIATGVFEGLHNGGELAPREGPKDEAGIFKDTILRALDRSHKDSFRSWRALNARVDERLSEERPLGPWLLLWAAHRDKIGGYWREFGNRRRDAWIVHVLEVLDGCGIPPTRNRDKKWLARAHGWEGEIDLDYNPLASCKVAADVLDIGTSAVERVWQDRDQVR